MSSPRIISLVPYIDPARLWAPMAVIDTEKVGDLLVADPDLVSMRVAVSSSTLTEYLSTGGKHRVSEARTNAL